MLFSILRLHAHVDGNLDEGDAGLYVIFVFWHKLFERGVPTPR